MDTLLPHLETNERAIEWLARRGQLSNSVQCPRCQQPAHYRRLSMALSTLRFHEICEERLVLQQQQSHAETDCNSDAQLVAGPAVKSDCL